MIETALKDPETHPPILLHGVTGSGKTEIYLQAIRATLARGKTAIVLVPEISLTPQTVERFKSRFAASRTWWRSCTAILSEGERHDEWHKIHAGRARIVIGARSAIFAPLENLGLIVVDEEHETYLQTGGSAALSRARRRGRAGEDREMRRPARHGHAVARKLLQRDPRANTR